MEGGVLLFQLWISEGGIVFRGKEAVGDDIKRETKRVERVIFRQMRK